MAERQMTEVIRPDLEERDPGKSIILLDEKNHHKGGEDPGVWVYGVRLRYFAILPYHMKVAEILPLFPNCSLHKAPGTSTGLPLCRFGVDSLFLIKDLSCPIPKFIPLQNKLRVSPLIGIQFSCWVLLSEPSTGESLRRRS